MYILILCLFLTSCVKHSHDGENHHRADSLYTELSAMRYSDIAAFDSLAKDLFSMAADDNELQMVANNAMAYSAMMQMDYNRSVELYRTVRDKSLCEIERLVADVGLMTICYRVSANRLFFDYRSSALSRIKRINEEYDYLSLDDRERWIVQNKYDINLAETPMDPHELARQLQMTPQSVNRICRNAIDKIKSSATA